MIKQETIKAVAEQAGSTQRETKKILQAYWMVIAEELKGLNDHHMPNVGTLALVDRAPRKGTNPLTGKPMDIPVRKSVVFHWAAPLKRAIRKQS